VAQLERESWIMGMGKERKEGRWRKKREGEVVEEMGIQKGGGEMRERGTEKITVPWLEKITEFLPYFLYIM